MLRLFYVAFGGARWDWTPMICVVAILTMAVGSVLALAQTDIKRLLAYSSIAHAGFLLTGFLGIRSLNLIGEDDISGVQAVLFYLMTYGFMTLAAFALVTVVRDAGGEATHLSRWAGLGKHLARSSPACSRSCCSAWPASRSRAASPASGRCSPRRSASERGPSS